MRDLAFLTEEWKPCPGFEKYYEISNYGRVRSFLKRKPISYTLNQKGYPQVRLWTNKKVTNRNPHRLVAQAFIPNPNNLPQVNHKDGNKLNIFVGNLEWVTNSENQLHAYKYGLQPSRAGENNCKAKVTNSVVTEFKTKYNSGRSLSSIAKEMNVPIEIFRNIVYGRTWKTHTMKILKRDERANNKKPILL